MLSTIQFEYKWISSSINVFSLILIFFFTLILTISHINNKIYSKSIKNLFTIRKK